MSDAHDALSMRKQMLVERSALARLQLVREARAVRRAFGWQGAARAMAAEPGALHLAVGMALSLAGPRLAARLCSIAGRVLLGVRLVRALLPRQSMKVSAPSNPEERT